MTDSSGQEAQFPGAPPGERGEQGERGETGARGPQSPRGVIYAAVGVLVLVLIMGAANLLATYQQVHASQVAQRRAGELVERKLCTTFGALAALKPPPGNPAANPSRAYLQQEHALLVQLGAGIGCAQAR